MTKPQLTRDDLLKLIDDKRFYSGGYVETLRNELPVIMDTHYRLPFASLPNMRLQPASDVRIVSSEFITREVRIEYTSIEAPRTGDRQQMVQDIDRVELTPATRQARLGQRIQQIVRERSRQIADQLKFPH